MPMGDKQLPVVAHFVAGVQAVDNVSAEAIYCGSDQTVIRTTLISKPRAQLGTFHRVGGAGNLPVVSPPNDVSANGFSSHNHILQLTLRRRSCRLHSGKSPDPEQASSAPVVWALTDFPIRTTTQCYFSVSTRRVRRISGNTQNDQGQLRKLNLT